MQRETIEERWLSGASSPRQEVITPQPAYNTQKHDLFFLLYMHVCQLMKILMCFTRSFESLWDIWNIIDSFSATDPGRIIYTLAIKSVISVWYVQKAASAPLLWPYAGNCESDYRCGFCLHFKRLQQVSLSVQFWQHIFEYSTKLCHEMPTHSVPSERFRRKETFTPVSVSLLEGTRGENKINGFNFILANKIPIKLKEKLKSGQCEH